MGELIFRIVAWVLQVFCIGVSACSSVLTCKFPFILYLPCYLVLLLFLVVCPPPSSARFKSRSTDSAPQIPANRPYQGQREYPQTPKQDVIQKPFIVHYGHRRQAGEFYVVLGIFVCWVVSAILGGHGLYRVSIGFRFSGGVLIGCGSFLALAATITGCSGRLPWQWLVLLALCIYFTPRGKAQSGPSKKTGDSCMGGAGDSK